MSDVTDYKQTWENVYRNAYDRGKRHWRPELATPVAFAEFMSSTAAPSANADILEAGCGDGLNAIRLALLGYTVTGVDISSSAIARAREIAAGQSVQVDFRCLDLARQRLPDTYACDLWVDIKTLHVLWEDADRRSYLAGAFAALRPGGVLFLNCALALCDVREHFPVLFTSLDEATQDQADTLDRTLPREKRSGIRCETLEWYCQELEQAGFEIHQARREASLRGGWGVVIVAKKG